MGSVEKPRRATIADLVDVANELRRQGRLGEYLFIYADGPGRIRLSRVEPPLHVYRFVVYGPRGRIWIIAM